MPRRNFEWDEEFESGRSRGRNVGGHGRGDRPRREKRRERRREPEPAAPAQARERVPQPGRREPRTYNPWGVQPAWALNADLLGGDDVAGRSGPSCGDCRNWQTRDEPDGRGECDHPGSGFSFPYRDTAACPFFDPRRGSYAPGR